MARPSEMYARFPSPEKKRSFAAEFTAEETTQGVARFPMEDTPTLIARGRHNESSPQREVRMIHVGSKKDIDPWSQL